MVDSKNKSLSLVLALVGPIAITQVESCTAPSSWSQNAARGGRLESAVVKCGCLEGTAWRFIIIFSSMKRLVRLEEIY